MESRVLPLMRILSLFPDKRHRRGLRHPLSSILGLVCVATLCGCRSPNAMSEWGRHSHRQLLEALGFGHRPPCANTISEVLAFLDAPHFENLLGRRAESLLASIPLPEGEKEAVAIDGKPFEESETKRSATKTKRSRSASPFGVSATIGRDTAPWTKRRMKSPSFKRFFRTCS